MTRSRMLDGAQGLVAFMGILLGVVPLAGWIIAGRHNGPFRLIFGDLQTPAAYVAPIAVIAGAVLIIAALEVAKKGLK
ncbi:hypothetical protein [Prauserella rugosa]|uniref:Uncharacterized protein n=1 Tax=Prauserella rugosa TaxID=43354 RepID=A0A660CBS5_9PSEU|nr:hypothetical protein [Prauserella rugosa]KID31980.1 hypothetical protein HQ32_00863 [Prauserella sp. Am3]TWH20766.1 hypothetical protein JD82_02614 [Prauserella rugosa]